MAIKLGDVFVAILAQDKTDKGYESARKKANKFISDLTTGIGQGVGQFIAQTVGNVVRGALDQIGKATQAAGDLNREIRRTNAVFGESAGDIRAWASTASTSLGLTESAALGAASGLGSMLVQLGSSREQAAIMSKQMVEAARDVAAFNGVTGGGTAILETFAAAFRGEYDSLQRYLPAITDASIKQQALADTGKKTAEQLTAQEKALATQTLILRGATIAAGAYATSLETGEGQQAKFTRRIEEGVARLGQIFVPIQQTFYQGLNGLLDIVAPYGQGILESFAGGLARGLVALTPFFAQLRQVFVTLLETHSPPKLLPELTKWGQQAMQEYLKGWTLADFDALQSVGSIMERVIRGFSASADIKETDLVSRVFGSQKAISQAIREFRELGYVTEGTFGAIADSIGPAGTEVAELVRRYYDLQRASKGVVDAQKELNDITDRYARALSPVNEKLDAVRNKQREITENQELEELGKVIKDPREDLDKRQLARLRAEEIQLERQQRALEGERDTALDGAQQKIDAAEKEREAQQQKFDLLEQALDQQIKTNELISEETALRERLIKEGIAEQKRVLAELEEQQRKEAAILERIADAQLRYRLELSDTAGDLEIMRGELAKVEEGSAEYFDILSQIHSLEERLRKEREAAGDPFAPITVEPGAGGKLEELTGGFKELDEALKGIFGALKGDGGEVKLSPFFAGVVETVGNIKVAVEGAIPIVTDFIDMLMGKSKGVPTADILRPVGEGGGGFWSSIIPGLRGVLAALELIKNNEWAALWNQFDVVMAENFKGTVIYDIYTYMRDTLIPALNLLAEGEWADAWALFSAPLAPLAEQAKQAGFDMMEGFWEGYVGWWAEKGFNLGQDIRRRLQEMFPGILPDDPGYGVPKPGPSLPDFTDPNASFPGGSFPGVTPLLPAMAAGNTSTVGDTYQFFVEQNIAANGDFGGARAGAEAGMASIRDTLIQRTLNGA